MFCGKCGKENSNDNNFCFACGAQLGAISPASKAAEPVAVVDKEKNEIHPSSWVIAILGVVFAISMIVYFTVRERGDDAPASERVVKSATFGSMQSCLQSIRSATRAELKIVTDTPDRVSGIISGGGFFGCKRVQSGSKGTS